MHKVAKTNSSTYNRDCLNTNKKIRMKNKLIRYSTNKKDLENLEIKGFFEGWPEKPNEDVLKKSIENSGVVVLAVDDEKKKLIGYITALTDGVLSAYIPFLEVQKNYQKQGIGHELVKRMTNELKDLYMIDLVCDKELADFYSEAGFVSWNAMIKRNYANQSGANGGRNA